jgi:hypothetical protein
VALRLCRRIFRRASGADEAQSSGCFGSEIVMRGISSLAAEVTRRGGTDCRWNNLEAELIGPGGEPLLLASEALRGLRRQFNPSANNPIF